MHITRQYPRFGRLLAALATSQLGDWLYNLALLAYVQQRTHSTAWLGITTAARIAPLVLGGPVGGLIADRLDRRRLMFASDVVRAGIMGTLVLVALAGLPVALVPVLAAAATLAGVVYPPSVAAVTPRLVDGAQLGAANAARGAIAPACVAAGPALGAVLLLIGPPAVAFAINAGTFIVSGLLIVSIPARPRVRPAPRPDGGDSAINTMRGLLRELRHGAQALWARPRPGGWSAPTPRPASSTARRPSCCSSSPRASGSAQTATAICSRPRAPAGSPGQPWPGASVAPPTGARRLPLRWRWSPCHCLSWPSPRASASPWRSASSVARAR